MYRATLKTRLLTENLVKAGGALMLLVLPTMPLRADCNHAVPSFSSPAADLLADPFALLAQQEENSRPEPQREREPTPCFHCGADSNGLPAPVQVETTPKDGLSGRAAPASPSLRLFTPSSVREPYLLQLVYRLERPPRSI